MRLVALGLVFLVAASMVFAGNQCVYDLDMGECIAPAPPQNTVLGQEPLNGVLLVLAFFLSIVVLVSYFMTVNTPETRQYWLEINRPGLQDFGGTPPAPKAVSRANARKTRGKAKR
ncbi:MAG: hypothetical protein V1834_02910 [Candidatus Micrarchaeota archaeon]